MTTAPAPDKLRETLANAGIEPDSFIESLKKSKRKGVSPEALTQTLEKVFGEKFHESVGAALSIRGTHLQSLNPESTFHTFNRMVVLQEPGAGVLRKIGAGFGAIRQAFSMSRHYLNTGVLSATKNALKLLAHFPDKGKAGVRWPKFGLPKEQVPLASLEVVEDILRNASHKGKGSAHIAQLLDVTPQALEGILTAAKNVLSDPGCRTSILDNIDKKMAGVAPEAFGKREIYVALNEVLGAVKKIHNPVDVKRITDVIAIAAEGKHKNPAGFMREYWKSGKEAIKLAADTVIHTPELPKEARKIAFAHNPLVNLGVAIATLGGAIFVGRHFAQAHDVTTESKDKQGNKVLHTQAVPADFWERAAKYTGVAALLAVSGLTVGRAAMLPNKEGLTFVEKLLVRDTKAVAKSVQSV